ASGARRARTGWKIPPDGTRSRRRTRAAESTARRAARHRRSLVLDRTRACDGPRCSSVVHPALEKSELAQRGQSEHGEKQGRTRRRIRWVPEPETDLVDVVEQE